MQIFGGWCVGGSPRYPPLNLPVVWATALPMTASCLSTLSEFESLLGA